MMDREGVETTQGKTINTSHPSFFPSSYSGSERLFLLLLLLLLQGRPGSWIVNERKGGGRRGGGEKGGHFSPLSFPFSTEREGGVLLGGEMLGGP